MLALILADGAFPTHPGRLDILKNMQTVICCDGAAEKLLTFGREPNAIVGDMDSLSDVLKTRFSDRIIPSDDQETNDLTKAVNYCAEKGYDELVILGATGLREDHTLGNIALLADYAPRFKSCCMLTDYGRIDAFTAGIETKDSLEENADTKAPLVCITRDGAHTVARFESFAGQQVSLFSLHPDTLVHSMGLRYPLEGRSLTSWWQGTLNECTGEQFSLSINKGCMLVYRLEKA